MRSMMWFPLIGEHPWAHFLGARRRVLVRNTHINTRNKQAGGRPFRACTAWKHPHGARWSFRLAPPSWARSRCRSGIEAAAAHPPLQAPRWAPGAPPGMAPQLCCGPRHRCWLLRCLRSPPCGSQVIRSKWVGGWWGVGRVGGGGEGGGGGGGASAGLGLVALWHAPRGPGAAALLAGSLRRR